MYLVINKWVTAVKVSNFSGHYLRNRSTLDIGVWGCIGIFEHKEHSPEVVILTSGTLCIHTHTHTHAYTYTYICIFIIPFLIISSCTSFFICSPIITVDLQLCSFQPAFPRSPSHNWDTIIWWGQLVWSLLISVRVPCVIKHPVTAVSGSPPSLYLSPPNILLQPCKQTTVARRRIPLILSQYFSYEIIRYVNLFCE